MKVNIAIIQKSHADCYIPHKEKNSLGSSCDCSENGIRQKLKQGDELRQKPIVKNQFISPQKPLAGWQKKAFVNGKVKGISDHEDEKARQKAGADKSQRIKHRFLPLGKLCPFPCKRIDDVWHFRIEIHAINPSYEVGRCMPAVKLK